MEPVYARRGPAGGDGVRIGDEPGRRRGPGLCIGTESGYGRDQRVSRPYHITDHRVASGHRDLDAVTDRTNNRSLVTDIMTPHSAALFAVILEGGVDYARRPDLG